MQPQTQTHTHKATYTHTHAQAIAGSTSQHAHKTSLYYETTGSHTNESISHTCPPPKKSRESRTFSNRCSAASGSFFFPHAQTIRLLVCDFIIKFASVREYTRMLACMHVHLKDLGFRNGFRDWLRDICICICIYVYK